MILTECQNCFFLPTEAVNFRRYKMKNSSMKKETILIECQKCFFLTTEAVNFRGYKMKSSSREKETILTEGVYS